MQFEHELAFLEHFGMPLAPEQRELMQSDGSTYMLCAMAVPDPVWFGREWAYEPLMFEQDDGTSSELWLPTVFERWPDDDVDECFDRMVDEAGWDPDRIRRLPCLLGRGYEPWNEHSLCMCCEDEPSVVRIWGLWPLEPDRARFLGGQLDSLFEASGWMDTFRHHRILDCEGYRNIEQVEETATAPLDPEIPEKLYQAMAAKQREAMNILEALADNPVKVEFKPDDFALQLEDELAESWTRLMARRSRFLAALPRVLPQHDPLERFFVQWP
jgi:hypothetical protein